MPGRHRQIAENARPPVERCTSGGAAQTTATVLSASPTKNEPGQSLQRVGEVRVMTSLTARSSCDAGNQDPENHMYATTDNNNYIITTAWKNLEERTTYSTTDLCRLSSLSLAKHRCSGGVGGIGSLANCERTISGDRSRDRRRCCCVPLLSRLFVASEFT